MVFHKYFQAGKKVEFRQKSTLFSPLRWRLPIFGQINIGWIPCLEFSFFMPFWGELSAVAFCYGAWFIGLVLVFGVRVWVNCWAILGSGIRMMFAVGAVKPKKLMLPYHTIELSMMAHCSVCSVLVFTYMPAFVRAASLCPSSFMCTAISNPLWSRLVSVVMIAGLYLNLTFGTAIITERLAVSKSSWNGVS